MSITPELLASARSAYRALFRASAVTFKGDDRVLNAWREKVRTEFRAGRTQTDPAAYKERVKLGHDVATVLRTNIVQGVRKAPNFNHSEGGKREDESVWELRYTEHTELGSNESIKQAINAPRPPRPKGGGCCSAPSPNLNLASEQQQPLSEQTVSTTTSAQSTQPPKPKKLNFSELKRAHQKRTKVELREEDLEESFVRGSGPGGQSINKTQNNVQLLHIPTGKRVSCQETRSLAQNRKIARKRLLELLDQMENPGLSKENVQRAKQLERERQRRKKAKKKAKKLAGDLEEGTSTDAQAAAGVGDSDYDVDSEERRR